MRRRRGGVILIIFGVLMAALVGGATFVLTQNATASTQEEVTRALKVVALVPERTLIPPTALEVIEVPTRVKPPTALSSLEEAVNKMALTALYPGDWVLSNRIADTKGQSGASFTLEPGNVMITFPPSDIVGTGAILPGDTVDILVTIDTSKETAQAIPGAAGQTASPGGVTQMTMQNLKVLNIGTVAQPKNTASGSGTPQPPAQTNQVITFSVPRQDALILKQIKDYPGAKIEVVLRAAGDQQLYTTEAVNMRALMERFKITAR